MLNYLLIFSNGDCMYTRWTLGQWEKFYFEVKAQGYQSRLFDDQNVIFSLDGIDLLLVNFG